MGVCFVLKNMHAIYHTTTKRIGPLGGCVSENKIQKIYWNLLEIHRFNIRVYTGIYWNFDALLYWNLKNILEKGTGIYWDFQKKIAGHPAHASVFSYKFSREL